MSTKRFIASTFAALLVTHGAASAATLNANATANNGGNAGWGLFFNLGAGSTPLTVTHLTTANSATANAAFSVEVFTRTGTALGGTLATGPGSSSAGWTSLGTVGATQGAVAQGISSLIDIPDIALSASSLTGVALLFTGAGPRYFGTGTGPAQTFSDAFLTLTTGDVRSVPFSTTGSYFTPRGLTGSLTYVTSPIPEPGALALTLFGLAGLAAWRRAS